MGFFIVSSKTSLKADLLPDGNAYALPLVAHLILTKEIYINLDIVLNYLVLELTIQWCFDLKLKVTQCLVNKINLQGFYVNGTSELVIVIGP